MPGPPYNQRMSSIDIRDQIARMSLRDKAGQMIMGLSDPSGIADTDELIRRHHLGSVMSFGFPRVTVSEAVERNRAMQEAAAEAGLPPLLNGGDFEQGAGSLVDGATTFPHQMGVAAAGDPAEAERAAEIAGREERALGYSWSFTPIVDVNVNPNNPVIGVRSYGSDVDTVCRFARSQIAGLRSAGIPSCAKHFPGHGDTDIDSHLDLPVLRGDRETFERVHLRPFREAIAAGVDSMMTAHIIVEALDPSLPATLSRPILTDLLRGELGFEGVVVTDHMNMKAVAARCGIADLTVMSVAAGADIVMVAGPTGETVEAIEALVAAVGRGDLDEEWMNRSIARIFRLKNHAGDGRAADNAIDRVATKDSLACARDLFECSISVFKNDGALPFPRDGTTLVAGTPVHSAHWQRMVSYAPLLAGFIRETASGDVPVWQSETIDPTDREIESARRAAEGADRAIVLTYRYGPLPEGQRTLVRALAGTGIPVAVLETSLPVGATAYPEASAVVANYALNFVPIILNSDEAFRAAAQTFYGSGPVPPFPGR